MEGEGKPEPSDEPLRVYLWPCNVPVYNLWCAVSTQWIVSMRGREGLNYESVLRYLREVAHIRPRRVPDVMRCLQAMELAALRAWDELREQEQANRASA